MSIGGGCATCDTSMTGELSMRAAGGGGGGAGDGGREIGAAAMGRKWV